MGYCSYYINPNGNAVATWVGTGTDVGKTKRVVFLKGARGATNKTAACNDAKNQFCKQYGLGGRCYAISTPTKCAKNLIEQNITGIPLCKDLTYPPDPYKGTGTLTPINPQSSSDRHKVICAKKCGWDPICLYDKVVEECGGGLNPCSAFPPPFNNCTFVALGVGALVLFLLLRR